MTYSEPYGSAGQQGRARPYSVRVSAMKQTEYTAKPTTSKTTFWKTTSPETVSLRNMQTTVR